MKSVTKPARNGGFVRKYHRHVKKMIQRPWKIFGIIIFSHAALQLPPARFGLYPSSSVSSAPNYLINSWILFALPGSLASISHQNMTVSHAMTTRDTCSISFCDLHRVHLLLWSKISCIFHDWVTRLFDWNEWLSGTNQPSVGLTQRLPTNFYVYWLETQWWRLGVPWMMTTTYTSGGDDYYA